MKSLEVVHLLSKSLVAEVLSNFDVWRDDVLDQFLDLYAGRGVGYYSDVSLLCFSVQ